MKTRRRRRLVSSRAVEAMIGHHCPLLASCWFATRRPSRQNTVGSGPLAQAAGLVSMREAPLNAFTILFRTRPHEINNVREIGSAARCI